MSWQRELGYEPGNTIDTLRYKYKRLALRKHPNKGGRKANFQRLGQAWENAQKALSVRAAATVAASFPSRQQPVGFTSIFRQPTTSTSPRRRTGLYAGRRPFSSEPYYNAPTPMDWEPTPMAPPRRSSSRPRGVAKRRTAPRRRQQARPSPYPRRRR